MLVQRIFLASSCICSSSTSPTPIPICFDANGLSSPCSRGDQSRPQQLPHTSPRVSFMGDPIFPDERESHITLLSSRFLLRSQLLGFGSQVDSKHFKTRRRNNSFFPAAFLKLLLSSRYLQEVSALLFPSFPPSVFDSFRPFFLYLSFQLLQNFFCHLSTNSLFLLSHKSCDVRRKHPSISEAGKF